MTRPPATTPMANLVTADSKLNCLTLRPGDQGTEVLALKKLLAHWDISTNTCNCLFDPSLEQAVKTFQYRMFLEATGIVSPLTWQALYAGAPVHMPRLQVGDRGEAVVQLQRALWVTGDYQSLVDGEFGPETQQAVRSFQRRQGLVEDGQVGVCTWRTLSKVAR